MSEQFAARVIADELRHRCPQQDPTLTDVLPYAPAGAVLKSTRRMVDMQRVSNCASCFELEPIEVRPCF